MVSKKELKDIKERGGVWCPFSKRKCKDNDCKLKDSITGACLFWLMNSNLYHIREELEEINEKLDGINEDIHG